MKRFLLLLLIGLARYSHAQNVEGQIVASQFGEFKVQNEGNGFAFDPANCNISGGGKNFPAFATGTPVKIVDTNPAQVEVVTPISALITGSYCAVSLPAHYAHTNFYLTSGTGGLQEAITNSRVLAGGPNTILLNAEWYQLVSPQNPATVIASLTGGSGFGLVDVTTTPYSYYQWNGSQFVAGVRKLPCFSRDCIQQQRLLFHECHFISNRSCAEHQPLDPAGARRVAGREQRLDGCRQAG